MDEKANIDARSECQALNNILLIRGQGCNNTVQSHKSLSVCEFKRETGESVSVRVRRVLCTSVRN